MIPKYHLKINKSRTLKIHKLIILLYVQLYNHILEQELFTSFQQFFYKYFLV